ncbi:MAG TPA: hypothetical protein VFO82_15030 [Steroidobacteraceae bacterium]|nr:hypothetical protein [Steroidobacteraceae bacterium]
MQTKYLCGALATLQFTVMLAGCSQSADNPYSKVQDPPLVRATLHTATIASPDAALAKQLAAAGYSYTPLISNYPAAVRVEALLWKVPEDFAATSIVLMAGSAGGPNLRMLIMPAAAVAPPVEVDAKVEEAFYRNVLGVDVPRLPDRVNLAGDARVQVWTYFVDDVVAASRRFREAGIAVTFDPVAITTAYLGDHRVMGIQAPDGTVIELVQSATQ